MKEEDLIYQVQENSIEVIKVQEHASLEESVSSGDGKYRLFRYYEEITHCLDKACLQSTRERAGLNAVPKTMA